MVKLLDHSMPSPPDEYDIEAFTRILRDIEMALTKIEFPAVVSGDDETQSMLWFGE
jgi:hypothetical protein